VTQDQFILSKDMPPQHFTQFLRTDASQKRKKHFTKMELIFQLTHPVAECEHIPLEQEV
jgi:hypothetical protein